MTAMLVESGQVSSSCLADGMLVQLQGVLDESVVPELRRVLLAPIPAECRDIVVDAGEITDIDFAALAIVFAAWGWAEEHGARFLLSRTSAAFEAMLADNGVVDDLPRLSELASAPDAAVIPLPRIPSV
jgi:anti-anti-sigma regulatory factor